MYKNTYAEKFKDPRWQQKRLEVFQRDEFKCRWCGSAERQLHAHHLYYISRRNPWAYPLGSLLTLCDDCHASESTVSEHWSPDSERDWEVIFSTGIPESGYDIDFAYEFGHCRRSCGLSVNELVRELICFMRATTKTDSEQKAMT